MSLSSSSLPKTTTSIVLRLSNPSSKPVYHHAVVEQRNLQPLQHGQVLVRMGAVGLNHRDVWIRKGQYPGIAFGSVMGADGAGTVVASYDPNDSILHKRVFLVPMRGWNDHPEAPESTLGILGGVRFPSLGTFSTYVAVTRDDVIPTPEHLNDVQAAAWPLGGVTAWRAAVVNGKVKRGDNILITGIGGGVALLAMQICLKLGAKVWVTSGSDTKLEKAIGLGASGGVNYKDPNWPSQLLSLLTRETSPTMLDSVIDSAGGDIFVKTRLVLKQGGRVVCYGMTSTPKIYFAMPNVLRNQKLIGSTMGSRKELVDATQFLAEHRIVPVISHIFDGLESGEEAFETMRRGDQSGKVVLRVRRSTEGLKAKSKL